MWTLILRRSIRRLRSDLQQPGGPDAKRASVAHTRENVARWLEIRAKPT
jgi:hypothetical protein